MLFRSGQWDGDEFVLPPCGLGAADPTTLANTNALEDTRVWSSLVLEWAGRLEPDTSFSSGDAVYIDRSPREHVPHRIVLPTRSQQGVGNSAQGSVCLGLNDYDDALRTTVPTAVEEAAEAAKRARVASTAAKAAEDAAAAGSRQGALCGQLSALKVDLEALL